MTTALRQRHRWVVMATAFPLRQVLGTSFRERCQCLEEFLIAIQCQMMNVDRSMSDPQIVAQIKTAEM